MFDLDFFSKIHRIVTRYELDMLTEEQGRLLMNTMLVLAALVALYMIVRFVEKMVSRFLPEKKEIVIVERTHFNQAGKKMKVRNVATGKKRIVLMPEAEYAAGAKGELVRKGRYGINFTQEVEEEKKDIKQYYQKNKYKK
ncbi:MAG: hypothetical protein IJN10_02110 [Firmicutes bacterium]|nr:hypothetical protein [Bacillota bacterium]